MGKMGSLNGAAVLSVVMGSAALLVVAGIVHSPGEAFRASLSGLQIWWQNVFPVLLPPLMLADLLAASGLLHGLSKLAEPLTRGLFRLPGASGWAISFGWAAGIPAGAKETARLRDAGLLRDEDVDTTLLVAHQPNPFLIILVIGCGFLHSPALGWAIALGLWLSAIVAGIAWARFARKPAPPLPPRDTSRGPLRRAVHAAAEARRADGRPLGKQLADSVTHTVGVLMAVGGLMMMSAVLIRLIQIWFPGNDIWVAFPGFYEMHLGAFESSRSPLFAAAPASAAALLAAALAWSGWSGLLQARAAFGTDIRFPWGRWIAGRLLHGALALLFTYPLALAATSKPVESFLYGLWPDRWIAMDAWAAEGPLPAGWGRLDETMLTALASFAIFLLLALAAALIRPKPPNSKNSGDTQKQGAPKP